MPAQKGELTEHYENRKVISVSGKNYRERAGLTTMLLMGYDRTGQASTVYRDGGQSDFMMLVVIDSAEKRVRRLQLDRDTMAAVGVLSVLGKDMGTSTLQLCLAHGYGANPQDCNERAVRAVSNLLQGVEIGFYVSMPMSGIPALNDVLGGVDVLIEDDFSGVDDTLIMGQTVHLMGEHAYNFLHERRSIGDGTNKGRMRRHQAYLNGATKQLTEHLNADGSFANRLLNAMDDVLETNMSKGRLINEINRAYQYDICPVDTISGEYSLGKNGFVEFYANEQDIVAWVLDTFYTPVD